MLSSGLAGAAPVPATAAAPAWAYGELTTVDFHGFAGLYTYQGSATLGFSVVFNETENSSDGVITVNAERTIGAIVNVRYCLPDCASPRVVANISYHAWETTDAWANLTTNGVVAEPHGNATALALLNSSVVVTAKLRESANSSEGATVLRDRSLAVNVTGHLDVNLTTPLGLFPLNVTSGDTWTSSSAFNASGAIVWSSYYTAFGTLVTLPGTLSQNGTAARSGNGSIGIAGAYRPGSGFAYEGTEFPAANLTVVGPFSLVEGVILVPAAADLFSSSSHPWTADQDGTTVVTNALLDVHAGRFYRGHLPIVSSGFYLASASSNVAVDLSPAHESTLPAALPAAGKTNSTFVQGQPESPAQAHSGQTCLITGVGCPLPGGPRSPLRFVLLVGAVAVVAILVAAGIAARRRPPAPVYPNAALYPPGATAPKEPTPSPAPKPAEEDPLGHLW
ncbi:MAG TPA: hypothetical protein VML94_02185 [Thermoplasmata archaeon]|nr:hypothetical protein [Thermoplasmata archaeon]